MSNLLNGIPVQTTLVPVTSSNIAAIGYSHTTKQLEVQFKGSGAVYSYAGVPQEAFDALMSAESIGSHFGKHIRGKFEGKKLEPEETQ